MKNTSRYYVNPDNHFRDHNAYVQVKADGRIDVVAKDGSKLEGYWKEATEVEAKSRLNNIYFTNVNGFTDGTAYVKFTDDDNYSFVSKNGTVSKNNCFGHVRGAKLSNALWYVEQGWWKEITEKEALALVKPNRYFTSIRGFTGGSLYVTVTAEGESSVTKVDKSVSTPWNDLDYCLRAVRDGIWKEITENEAKAMVDGSQYDKVLKAISEAQTVLKTIDNVEMPAYVARKVATAEQELELTRKFLKTSK